MPGQGISRTSVPTNTRAIAEELWEVVNEVLVQLADIKAKYEAHTHNGDGAQVGSYFTSPPRTDAATVTAGSASTVGTTPARMQH